MNNKELTQKEYNKRIFGLINEMQKFSMKQCIGSRGSNVDESLLISYEMRTFIRTSITFSFTAQRIGSQEFGSDLSGVAKNGEVYDFVYKPLEIYTQTDSMSVNKIKKVAVKVKRFMKHFQDHKRFLR